MEANSSVIANTVIGRRIVALMGAAALVGVAVTLVAFAVVQQVRVRHEINAQMRAIAATVGADYLEGVQQGRSDPAPVAFRSLSSKPYVLSASVLNEAGLVLSQLDEGTFTKTANSSSGTAGEQYLLVYPIVSSGRTNVVVRLVVTGSMPLQGSRSQLGSILLAGLVGLVAAFGVAPWLQRSFSRRVEGLDGFAQRVVAEKNHSLRSEASGADELRNIADNVNVIVSRVEDGEKKLLHSTRQLEEQTRKCEEARAEVAAQAQTRKNYEMNREQLMATLRSMPEGVIVTDREGRIVLLNRAAESLTGWPVAEALSLPIEVVFLLTNGSERIPGNSLVTSVLEGEKSASLPEGVQLSSRAGIDHPIAASASPVEDESRQCLGAVLVFRDVNQERIEANVRMSNGRMEAVNALASGIAHNFNNVLTVILGNLEFARSCANPDPQLVESLDAATQASLQAREITRRVLGFSSRTGALKRTNDLNNLIQQRVAFVLESAMVRCHFTLSEELWDVEINPGQIEQAIEQLVQNAVQAMPSGGELQVMSHNVQPEEVAKLPLPKGRYVRLTIRDSGKGISSADLERIFDPFFTTRARSTGLGLTCVYHILRKHGGLITAESVVGQGSSFHIYLPAMASELKAGSGVAGRAVLGGNDHSLVS